MQLFILRIYTIIYISYLNMFKIYKEINRKIIIIMKIITLTIIMLIFIIRMITTICVIRVRLAVMYSRRQIYCYKNMTLA